MNISQKITHLFLLTLFVIVVAVPSTFGWERKDKKQRLRSNQGTALLRKSNGIASNLFATHQKGLQWMMMANFGELGNPDDRLPDETPFAAGSSNLTAELEYPGGSGTQFLFSSGIWIGAIKNGEKIVSTVTDGDDGTNEFGPVMGWLTQSKETSAKGVDDDGDWSLADDLDGDGMPSADWDGPEADANGDGIFDYDPEPHIDEDPVGDISNDFIDNDFDGLIDAADPDFDGDAVVGSNDDDGDGLEDEDNLARAGQEWITAYVDTCATCLSSADPDGFTPLGVRVVQHSYQWSESFADDFIIIDYIITNIGDSVLEDVWLASFFDVDVGHITQASTVRSEDDITFYIDSLQTAIGGDNDTDNGLLSAQFVGVRVLQTPKPRSEITISYLNFGRLSGADPTDNLEKYDLISSGRRDPDQFDTEDWRFIFAFGPLGSIAPGETLPVTLAIVNGFDLESIVRHSRQALNMFLADFRGPAAPDAPNFTAEAVGREVRITWEDNAESSVDPITKTADFEGYRVWRTLDGLDFTLVADFDMVNGLGFDRGMPAVNQEGLYEFVDRGMRPLTQLRYVVTAFDNGDNGDGIGHPESDRATGQVGELESTRGVERQQTVISGSSPKSALDEVYVVPNPYIGSSEFERFGRIDAAGNPSFPKLIQFVNLPPQATIKIYTLAGDLVRQLDHSDGSGVEVWNLRTKLDQEAVAGIYLYQVETGGQQKIGKFLVIK